MPTDHQLLQTNTAQFKRKSKLVGKKRQAEEDILSLLEKTAEEDSSLKNELGSRE